MTSYLFANTQEQKLERMADELQSLEERHARSDVLTMVLICIVCLTCAAVIIPYRSVHLPKQLMFASGVCAFLLCMPLVLEDHEKLIFIFLAYMPFSKVVPGTFGRIVSTFNATNILLLFIVAGWATSKTLRGGSRFQLKRLDISIACFIFLAVVSLIRGFMLTEGRPPLDVIFACKRWITPIIIYYIVTNNLSTIRQSKMATITIAITTGLIGIMGLKEFYMDVGSRSNIEKMRIAVTSGPNHLGFLLCSCVFILIAIWYVYRKEDRRYHLLWIPIMACIQSMRLTFSRGAMLGLLVGLWYFLYLTNRRWCMGFTVVGLFLAINITTIPAKYSGRMAHTISSGEGPLANRLDRSAAGRVAIWRGGIQMFLNDPVLGVGYNNFRRVIGHYTPEHAYRDAHNTYLIVATEMGGIALLVFLAMLWKIWRTSVYVYKNSAEDPILRASSLGFLSMLAATCVANLFGSRFDSAEVTIQFYVMTAVMCNFAHIVDLRLELGRKGPMFAENEEIDIPQTAFPPGRHA